MVEFRVYKIERKRFNFENVTVYSVFFISVILALTFNRIDLPIPELIFKITGVLSIIFMVFFKLIQHKRFERLKTSYVGIAKFSPEKIILIDREIDIQDIEIFELRIQNYEGKSTFPMEGDFTPALSRGLNNKVNIKLKNNENIDFNIKLDIEYQEKQLEETLINLMDLGAISVIKVSKLLRLKNYEEIQNLKNKHYRQQKIQFMPQLLGIKTINSIFENGLNQ